MHTTTLPLSISNIHLDKKTIFPDKSNSATIHYKLSKAAFVTVSIFNSNDMLIRTLVSSTLQSLGKQHITWDGEDDTGNIVPSGAYTYIIEATTEEGETTFYDRVDTTGGLVLKVRHPTIDIENETISYIMPKAGMVRIRAGIKNGPLLKTLFDWQPREAGKNSEKWDGRDKSGHIDLYKIEKREVYIFAYSLPDNSIIVQSEVQHSAIAPVTKKTNTYRIKRKINHKKKYKHAVEDQAINHEPEFQITFPNAPKTPDGVPILNGTAPVKIAVSEEDRLHLESSRFEVMFFVDTKFIFEDEEGFTPFTYMWNTQDLTEGEHIITVNILSYDDHCGTESRKVFIRR